MTGIIISTIYSPNEYIISVFSFILFTYFFVRCFKFHIGILLTQFIGLFAFPPISIILTLAISPIAIGRSIYDMFENRNRESAYYLLTFNLILIMLGVMSLVIIFIIYIWGLNN